MAVTDTIIDTLLYENLRALLLTSEFDLSITAQIVMNRSSREDWDMYVMCSV
jgi:hypothetical protein